MCEEGKYSFLSLVLLAVSIVLVGARRALKEPYCEEASIDSRSALLFPVIASSFLLCLFFARLQSIVVIALACASFSNARYVLNTWIALAVVVGWLATGHWVFVDILGACTCVTCVALVELENLKVACLCLGSLFVYDAFWVYASPAVFGTNVMIDVANKVAVVRGATLQLPIKLLVPLCHSFQVLGLGDVAIPGLLVAFAARFDVFLSKKRRKRQFWYATLATLGYVVGLVAASIAASTFGPQPALVFIVPACLVPVVLASLLRGHFLLLWRGFDDDDRGHPGASPLEEC